MPLTILAIPRMMTWRKALTSDSHVLSRLPNRCPSSDDPSSEAPPRAHPWSRMNVHQRSIAGTVTIILHRVMMYVHRMINIIVIQRGGKILSFNIIAVSVSASCHHKPSKRVSSSRPLLYPPLTFLPQRERPFAGVGHRSSPNFVVRGLNRSRAIVLLPRPSKLLPKSYSHSSITVSVEWLRELECLCNTVPPG